MLTTNIQNIVLNLKLITSDFKLCTWLKFSAEIQRCQSFPENDNKILPKSNWSIAIKRAIYKIKLTLIILCPRCFHSPRCCPPNHCCSLHHRCPLSSLSSSSSSSSSWYSKRYCSNVDWRKPVILGNSIELSLSLICSCQYQNLSVKDQIIRSAHKDYMYLLWRFCSNLGPRFL